MVNMDVVVLLIACCGPIFGIVGLILALRWKNQVTRSFNTFINAQDAETPSPFAQTVVAMAKVSAPEFTQSLKGSMMGQASAMSKAVDGIEGDIAGDTLAQTNPAIAALLAFSPALAKRIKRSPAAALALSNLNLGSLGKGGNNKGKASESTFKLG